MLLTEIHCCIVFTASVLDVSPESVQRSLLLLLKAVPSNAFWFVHHSVPSKGGGWNAQKKGNPFTLSSSFLLKIRVCLVGPVLGELSDCRWAPEECLWVEYLSLPWAKPWGQDVSVLGTGGLGTLLFDTPVHVHPLLSTEDWGIFFICSALKCSEKSMRQKVCIKNNLLHYQGENILCFRLFEDEAHRVSFT